MHTNWLFDVSSIGQFFKRLAILIVSIILFLVYVVGVGSAVTYITMMNPDNTGHILIGSTLGNYITFMAIPALIIVIIIIFFIARDFSIPSRTIDFSPAASVKSHRARGSKKYLLVFAAVIIGCIVWFYYCINNYYAVFENKIVKHNLISSKQKVYNYGDISEVIIGVKNRGKYGGSLYYKVIFKDGYNINITENLMSGEDALQSIQKLNEVVKANGIKRNIDKTHFHDLVEDLDIQYANEYEKLFE